MNQRLIFAVTILLQLLLPLAFAEKPALDPGDELAAFAINDQHGQPVELDEDVRLLMFSRDMGANKLVKKAFLERPGDYLPQHHAVYMIDVSGMPTFVTKTFAIPKMQKYPYRIFLDRDASLTAGLPSRKKRVTLVRLDRLKVTGIDFADTADELTRAVEAAAAQ
tara:strand:- start:200 stop:694 length:495 start_codon:yes stop_codon:yes gene_type:complete